MDCQKTQSNVLNYINHKLEQEQTKAFIEHIKTCEECREELEIYYIMIVGMRQLDLGEVLTADFKKELEEDMERRYEKIQRERDRKRLLFLFLLLSLVGIGLWGVGKLLLFFLPFPEIFPFLP